MLDREELAARIAEMQEEFQDAWRMLMVAPEGAPVMTGAGVPLKRTRYSMEPGVVLIEASQDGLPIETSRWHTGVSEDVVYCERWVNGERKFHGYVDVATRHLVQAG